MDAQNDSVSNYLGLVEALSSNSSDDEVMSSTIRSLNITLQENKGTIVPIIDIETLSLKAMVVFEQSGSLDVMSGICTLIDILWTMKAEFQQPLLTCAPYLLNKLVLYDCEKLATSIARVMEVFIVKEPEVFIENNGFEIFIQFVDCPDLNAREMSSQILKLLCGSVKLLQHFQKLRDMLIKQMKSEVFAIQSCVMTCAKNLIQRFKDCKDCPTLFSNYDIVIMFINKLMLTQEFNNKTQNCTLDLVYTLCTRCPGFTAQLLKSGFSKSLLSGVVENPDAGVNEHYNFRALDRGSMLRIFYVVRDILPPLPNEEYMLRDDLVKTRFRYPERTADVLSKDDAGLATEFANRLLEALVLYDKFGISEYKDVLQDTLLKLFYHADPELIKRHQDYKIHAEDIARLLSLDYLPSIMAGMQITAILMKIQPEAYDSSFSENGVWLLMDRLTKVVNCEDFPFYDPSSATQKIFINVNDSSDILVSFNQIVTETMCPIKKAKAKAWIFAQALEFTKKCYKNRSSSSYFITVDRLQEIKCQLKKEPSIEQITKFLEVVTDKQVLPSAIIHSGIVEVFMEIIRPRHAVEVKDIFENAKDFLSSVFDSSEDLNVQNSLFRSLVVKIVSCLNLLVEIGDLNLNELVPKSLNSLKTNSNERQAILEIFRCSHLTDLLRLNVFENPRKMFPVTLDCLVVLHVLNRNWGVLFEVINFSPLVESQVFESESFTFLAKLHMKWDHKNKSIHHCQKSIKIATFLPFLLPFEVRQTLFYAAAFDKERALHKINRYLNPSEEIHTMDTEILSYKVSRRNVIKDVKRILEKNYGTSNLLEFSFNGEFATGEGPTLEVYAKLSQELQSHHLSLWRGKPMEVGGLENCDEESDSEDNYDSSNTRNKEKEIGCPNPSERFYTFSDSGLFPLPSTDEANLELFQFIGMLMARSLKDFKKIDLPLSSVVFKWLRNSLEDQRVLGLADIADVIPEMSGLIQSLLYCEMDIRDIENDTSLSQEKKEEQINDITLEDGSSFEDLCLNFCRPGSSDVEMKQGGRDIILGPDNVNEYLILIINDFLNSSSKPLLDAMVLGFGKIINTSFLAMFYPEELDELFCGKGFEEWTPKYLRECCKFQGGYTYVSRTINNFVDILSKFDASEQRAFIRYATGFHKLPAEGFKGLRPQLTVMQMDTKSKNPDGYLPTVMTCGNYLVLPNYSSKEIMKSKLLQAISMGQYKFQFL